MASSHARLAARGPNLSGDLMELFTLGKASGHGDAINRDALAPVYRHCAEVNGLEQPEHGLLIILCNHKRQKKLSNKGEKGVSGNKGVKGEATRG